MSIDYGRIEGDNVVYGSPPPVAPDESSTAITAEGMLGNRKTLIRLQFHSKLNCIGVPKRFYDREDRVMEMQAKLDIIGSIIFGAMVLGVGIGITAYAASGYGINDPWLQLTLAGAGLSGAGMAMMLFPPFMTYEAIQAKREKSLSEELDQNQLQLLLDKVKANLDVEAQRLEVKREGVVAEAEDRVMAAAEAESEISALRAQFE